MKRINTTIILLLVGLTVFAQSGADTVSLNGTWKFKTLLGEGSNYLQIKPKETDIIIDNSQHDLVEVNGKWKVDSVATRMSNAWGADYLSHFFAEGDTTTNVRFNTQVPESGYYEHFIYYPFGHHLTTQINIKHQEGLTRKYNSLRNRCSKWVSLGVYKLEKGNQNHVEFTAISGGGVVVDAIMLRPVPKEKYDHAQVQKSKVVRSDFMDANWKTLPVPGHWGMLNEYSNYTGKGWYRKEIKLPETWTSSSRERVRLKFEGVYHIAKIYLNGQYVGEHQGGFTPFEFDVTEYLNFDGKNVLAVEADNSSIVGATWNWGGINREVYLVKNNDLRIPYQYMHADPNLKTGEAHLTNKIRIENNANADREVDLIVKVIKEDTLLSLEKRVVAKANAVTEVELAGMLSAEQVKLWHFDMPELYEVQSSVIEKGNVLDVRKENFGIRKFEITNTQMLLNGEPVRLAGFNRVSDHRFWGSSEPQEIIDLDIKLMKDAGANFMRIMHGTQNKKLIEACDREGILLFEEVNVRELTNPEFVTADYQPDYTLIKQWLTEMIERDVNHASIVGWSVGNELSHHYDYVKTIIPWVKENLDAYRAVTCVSNTGHRKHDNRENDPMEFGDINMLNIYHNKPTMVMDSVHARWPEKATFFSEFGAGRFTTPDLDNDIAETLPAWYAHIRDQRLYTTGASMWTFNDYKSGYSQTLESENRAWGVVNAWRTKRRSYTTFQQENSPVKDIRVEKLDLKRRKTSVVIPIRSATDFPSYTMKGYQLKVIFKDQSGKVLSTMEKELPVLLPNDGEWKGDLKWSKFKGEVFDIQLTLVSTNGYTRFDKTIAIEAPQAPVIEEVIAGEKSIRVVFNKAYGMQEHFVRYSVDGKTMESAKTIANYIDIDSLETQQKIQVELFAVNDKGISQASKVVNTKLTNKLLPPIVWDGFIRHNMLVAGYSGEADDVRYVVRYGTSKDELKQIAKTISRGMITIPLNGEKSLFFQIKRVTETGKSGWSNIVEAKDKAFRIYQ
ncbi:glycoside hydrolase family 2 TIM barrel-domain containing protein [Limibacter armeniacum]|uniref:glycoside hydrolase family 2 TIM barrel-domain containing protein n=1 Tax=Limibacter armeniacum TaxID=466084 RepID=UPI002FE5F74D